MLDTSSTAPVRIGIIGLGSAGMLHAQALSDGLVPGAILSAVVSRSGSFPEPTAPFSSEIAHFETLEALLEASVCDAVIVATPHLMHPAQTIAAFAAGCHVLCEKPASIRLSDAREMAASALQHDCHYSLNYNRRVVPLYRRLRELVHTGKIGEMRRVHWTSTSWLRVQSYFDTSPWRGTWAGEGGGLLVNQWPHILDLWQWICGMPTRLQAHCAFGRHHNIEVEDEVHIYAEYGRGATVTLVGSTGEAPGSERIEIVGSRGSIISEGNQLTITTLEMPVEEYIASAQPGFPRPETRVETEMLDAEGDLVTGITRDFVNVLQSKTPGSLIAPGADGVNGVMLANAVLLSAWADGSWIELPLDTAAGAEFDRLLAEKIAGSKPRTARESTIFSLTDSFRKP
ncbi:MAG: Gfo/Idh/MocA family oxidoreductase [Armatimonadota bacterium]